ncbi:hypothetical protein [Streptomyces sp. 3N207]|uniref:hypothetical protein n=1 Tax=Streptomyces sp. 3N207 TaxID=3457417 RepID=UPI003FD11988
MTSTVVFGVFLVQAEEPTAEALDAPVRAPVTTMAPTASAPAALPINLDFFMHTRFS